MEKTKKNYQMFNDAIEAGKKCMECGNKEWSEKWNERIDSIMEKAPIGSGIDCGIKLNIEESSYDSKIVFDFDFHHMDENGGYDGWTIHRAIITPGFTNINVTINGVNKNGIKDYLADLFYNWMNEEYTEI